MESSVLTAPASTGAFDSVAWDAARSRVVQASREAGNVHLDTVPAFVETMRGRSIFYVHDPRVRGTIRTVDNWRNVYVHWDDEYSANSEMANETVENGRKVFQSSLTQSYLKDYALWPDRRQAAAGPDAGAHETVARTCAPQDVCDDSNTTTKDTESMSLLTTLLPLLGGATEVTLTLKGEAGGGVSALVVSRIDPKLIGSSEPELAALATALGQPLYIKAATARDAEDAILAHLRTAAAMRAEAVEVLDEYQATLKAATEAAEAKKQEAQAKIKGKGGKPAKAPGVAASAVPAAAIENDDDDSDTDSDTDTEATTTTASPSGMGGLFD